MKLTPIILLAVYVIESNGWKCTYTYQPVCASDGKTYKNSCDLREAKMADKDLQILYNDACDQFSTILKLLNRQSNYQRSKRLFSGGLRNENFDLVFLHGPLHNVLMSPLEDRHRRE